MNFLRRILGGADVRIEEDTGALRVSDPEILAAVEAPGTPLAVAEVSDPGDDSYTDSGLTVSRACTRLSAMVGDSGLILSLDGGTTDHVFLPPNSVDEWDVAVESGADIDVKRMTTGVPFSDVRLGVR